MLIDCQSCPVRGRRCQECMVTTLLASPVPLPDPVAGPGSGVGDAAAASSGRTDPDRPAAELALDATERAAVAAFVQAGLVRPDEAAGLRARREPWGAYRAVS